MVDALPTLTLTLDNLGEAAELERGDWPADRPLGQHPSVTQALPTLLDALAAEALLATFFVEASNVAIYPEAIATIAGAGHEIGLHAWRHERWSALAPEREAELLGRGVGAFAAAGIDVQGFRPPGGALTPSSLDLVAAAGLRWCSPEGDRPHVDGRLAVIPFRWPLVDAYHLAPHFAARRRLHGDSAQTTPPETMVDGFLAEVERLRRDGGQSTLVLHPFLAVDPDTLAAVLRLLSALGELVRAGDLAVGPGGPLAAALLAAG